MYLFACFIKGHICLEFVVYDEKTLKVFEIYRSYREHVKKLEFLADSPLKWRVLLLRSPIFCQELPDDAA